MRTALPGAFQPGPRQSPGAAAGTPVHEAAPARPVFVVGSPRSGTTLAGALLGSAAGVSDLGEYAGYYFCHRTGPGELLPMPAKGMPRYVE
jgi:hypothetical protein